MSEVTGGALYKIVAGGLSLQVRSEVPLAKGDLLRLVVELAGDDAILRILPAEAEPSASTPASSSTTPAEISLRPGPSAVATPTARPASPPDRTALALWAAFRAEGLPLEPALTALAQRFLALSGAAPDDAVPFLRTAAYLLARGISPEGEPARGLGELVSGRTPLPKAFPEELRSLDRLAVRDGFSALRELLGRGSSRKEIHGDILRLQETGRLVLAARREVADAAIRLLQDRPALRFLDEAILSLARPLARPHPELRAASLGPDASGSSRSPAADAALQRLVRALEDGDAVSARSLLEKEVPSLDPGERERWREGLLALESRVLAGDPDFQQLRAAHRALDPVAARLEGQRLLSALEGDRGDLVYAGGLPFEEGDAGRIHVYRRRRDGSSGDSPESSSIYLDLVTRSLGRVQGWIRLVEGALSIRFAVERESTRAVFGELAPSLEGSLAARGYRPSIGIDAGPPPKEELGNLVEPDRGVESAHAGGIDLWV